MHCGDTMASCCPLEGHAAQPPLSLVALHLGRDRQEQDSHRLSAVKLRSQWGPVCPQTKPGSLARPQQQGPSPGPGLSRCAWSKGAQAVCGQAQRSCQGDQSGEKSR